MVLTLKVDEVETKFPYEEQRSRELLRARYVPMGNCPKAISQLTDKLMTKTRNQCSECWCSPSDLETIEIVGESKLEPRSGVYILFGSFGGCLRTCFWFSTIAKVASNSGCRSFCGSAACLSAKSTVVRTLLSIWKINSILELFSWSDKLKCLINYKLVFLRFRWSATEIDGLISCSPRLRSKI